MNRRECDYTSNDCGIRKGRWCRTDQEPPAERGVGARCVQGRVLLAADRAKLEGCGHSRARAWRSELMDSERQRTAEVRRRREGGEGEEAHR